MERWHAKVISGIAMFIVILICFLLPIKLTGFFRRRGDKGQHFLDLLGCFAGGVFLAAYLIFMAPSVRQLLLENLMQPNAIEYPIPDMLIGVGFFILLIVNRTVITMSKVSKRRSKRLKERKQLTASPNIGAGDCQRDLSEKKGANGSIHSVVRVDTATEFGENGADSMDIDADASEDACPVHGHSPYPLPRRSSITDVAQQDSTVRSIVMMLALSLDSILEGITTGLKTTIVEVWAIFIGNLVHETVIAFCLGLQLVRVHNTYKPVIIAAIAYALMNPVGLFLTTSIFESVRTSPSIDLANGLFQALSSGCFIYVTFCEILEGQITHRTSFAKIGAMFAGYATMAVFAAVPGSSAYDFVNDDKNTTCSTTLRDGN